MTLRLLSAGAAEGLIETLRPQFSSAIGTNLEGSFGPAGAIKEKFLSGQACDVIILTTQLIDELTRQGHLLAGSSVALGRVATGVAVREGEPLPDLSDTVSFHASLKAAKGIYFSDPQHSTAGIHFINVLRNLGIHDAVQEQLRPFKSGAVAMRELAHSQGPHLLGCTQITEIHHTQGIRLAGPFPPEFQLKTIYAAAVCSRATDRELASGLVGLMSGPGSEALRAEAGFEL